MGPLVSYLFNTETETDQNTQKVLKIEKFQYGLPAFLSIIKEQKSEEIQLEKQQLKITNTILPSYLTQIQAEIELLKNVSSQEIFQFAVFNLEQKLTDQVLTDQSLQNIQNMNNFRSELQLGKIEYFEKNQLIEEGIEECESLIEKDPDNLQCMYYLGIFLMAKEKYVQAFTLLKNVADTIFEKEKWASKERILYHNSRNLQEHIRLCVEGKEILEEEYTTKDLLRFSGRLIPSLIVSLQLSRLLTKGKLKSNKGLTAVLGLTTMFMTLSYAQTTWQKLASIAGLGSLAYYLK